MSGTAPSALAVAQVEHRHHDQIEQRRAHEAAEDHHRHRVLDLVPGRVAARAPAAAARAPSRARSWRWATSRSARAADHELGAEAACPRVLEVTEVRHQHDAVARRDADHRDEPDQRPERHDAARQHGRGDTPPTSANGKLASTSSVSRGERKSAQSTSAIPISASSAASARRDARASMRAACSPSSSAWWPGAAAGARRRAPRSRADDRAEIGAGVEVDDHVELSRARVVRDRVLHRHDRAPSRRRRAAPACARRWRWRDRAERADVATHALARPTPRRRAAAVRARSGRRARPARACDARAARRAGLDARARRSARGRAGSRSAGRAPATRAARARRPRCASSACRERRAPRSRSAARLEP